MPNIMYEPTVLYSVYIDKKSLLALEIWTQIGLD